MVGLFRGLNPFHPRWVGRLGPSGVADQHRRDLRVRHRYGPRALGAHGLLTAVPLAESPSDSTHGDPDPKHGTGVAVVPLVPRPATFARFTSARSVRSSALRF